MRLMIAATALALSAPAGAATATLVADDVEFGRAYDLFVVPSVSGDSFYFTIEWNPAIQLFGSVTGPGVYSFNYYDTLDGQPYLTGNEEYFGFGCSLDTNCTTEYTEVTVAPGLVRALEDASNVLGLRRKHSA